MKKITRKILTGITSVLALAGTPKNTNADYITHISEVYNIPIERLQVLRGELFNDLNLEGLIGDFNYDLRDESFKIYMAARFGDEGESVYNFMNQGRTKEFGVSRDSTGHVFLNRFDRMLVTPDSVEAISLPLTAGTGSFMNQLALKVNSPQSAIHRIKQNKGAVNFEIVGGDDPNYILENLPATVLRRVIPGTTFMTKDEMEEFYQASGIKKSLREVFNMQDGLGERFVDIFQREIDSRLHVGYTIEENLSNTSIELRENETSLTTPTTVQYNVQTSPQVRLDFTNPNHMIVLGLRELGLRDLEDVVASATSDSAIAAGSDSSTTEYAPVDSARATEETATVAITTTAPARREEKTEETRKGIVVAAEYSNLSMYPTAILGARIGNLMPFAAYGLDRNSLDERVVMPIDSQGRHTEFDINTNGETKRFVAGLNYVHEFENKKSAEKLAVILGLHAGRESANSSGTSLPTRYSNELPVEVKPSTSLNGKNSSYVWGPNFGIQYGRFGVIGSADIGRKVNQFGVESTSKRIGAGLIYNLDGGKNE